MKVKVQLMVAGKLFNEIVNAANYADAQKVALARNPNATIVSTTAVFKLMGFDSRTKKNLEQSLGSIKMLKWICYQ